MKAKIYEKPALKNSLWSTLKEFLNGDERFYQIIEELVASRKLSPQALFDELNRTKVCHKKHLAPSLIKNKVKQYKSDHPHDWKVRLHQEGYTKEARNKTEEKDDTAGWYHSSREQPDAFTQKYMDWVERLYWKYSIPPTIFTVDDTEASTITKSKHQVIDLKLDTKRPRFIEHWKADYMDCFHASISDSMDRIIIADYLEDFSEKGEKLAPYYKVHGALYTAIENRMAEKKKKPILYSRVISLPIRKSVPEDKSIDDLIDEFVKLCSTPLFIHICKCLKNNLFDLQKQINSSTEIDNVCKPGIYLANLCSRPYQHGLIDNQYYSELYRYNLQGHCYPDIMHSERVSIESELFRLTTNEFKAVFNSDKSIEGESIPKINQLLPLDNLNLIKDSLDRFYHTDKSTKFSLLRTKQEIFEQIEKGEALEYQTYN